MSNTIALLHATKALLNQGWCQGTMAQSYSVITEGKGRLRVEYVPLLSYRDPDAVRWCLEGAIKKIREETPDPDDKNTDLFSIWDERKAFSLLEQAIGLKKGDSLIAWQDERGRTQEDVLHAIDRAIQFVNGQDTAQAVFMDVKPSEAISVRNLSIVKGGRENCED